MEITDRMIGRTIYLTIIILLAALAVFLYLRTQSCTDTLVAAEDGAVQTAENMTISEENETVTSVESCADDEKNQDETDIDCGGDVCDSCAEGKDCVRNTDCAGGSCRSGFCNATTVAKPSSLTISKLNYSLPEDTAARITGITFSVHNGEAVPKEFTVELYVKNEDDDYLNQNGDVDAGDEKPFTTIELPIMSADKTEIFTYDIRPLSPSAGYLITNDYYSAGDNFLVEARFMDGDTLIKKVEWKK